MNESKLKAQHGAEEQASKRQKYYLVVGELVYIHKDDENQAPTSIRANAVVMSTTGNFAIPQLAQAQQALQQGFFQRTGAVEQVTILDVVIMDLIPLGEFTKEEFNLPPNVHDVQQLSPEILDELLRNTEEAVN